MKKTIAREGRCHCCVMGQDGPIEAEIGNCIRAVRDALTPEEYSDLTIKHSSIGIVLLTVLAGLIVGVLVFFFGLN